jgi:hypothetical protein
MEWSKIKNILIIALLLINVLFLYMMAQPSGAESDGGNQETLLADTLSVLGDNGITVRADTGFDAPELPILTLQFDGDNGTYDYAPSGKSLYLNEDSALEEADRFITEKGTFGTLGKEIRADSITVSESRPDWFVVTYGGYYENYRIKELYVTCTVSSSGVLRMEKQWAQVTEAGRNRRALIPVTSALLHYMDRVLSDEPGAEKTVTGISVAYTVNTPYDGTVASDTAFPAWRFDASDGNSVYIPAYQ